MKDFYTSTKTSTDTGDGLIFKEENVPCLLVAFAPDGATTVDRCVVAPVFVVGRSPTSDFVINDRRVSKRHIRITSEKDGFWITDMGSKNGTFLNGCRLREKQRLSGRDIIRAGSSILIFHDSAASTLQPMPLERFNIVGDFYAGPLAREISAAAFSNLHILVTGPSGAGKELVARALASILKKMTPNAPFIIHNAARFSSEEEATTTLFGVGSKVFSDVSARPGLIEQAEGGLLFLDEVHNLPERVQRALLRIIEDGMYSRIGETKARRIQVRFILASNASEPTFGLAHDLLARLRLVQVPSLDQRVADIPSIFLAVLKNATVECGVNFDQLTSALHTDLFETLCVDGFKTDNVRGMIVVADKVASYLTMGVAPERALAAVFLDRFKHNPVVKRVKGEAGIVPQQGATEGIGLDLMKFDVDSLDFENVFETSHYEQHKNIIISVFRQAGGNVSAAIRALNANGIHCSRRWLDSYLDRWGVERRRYKKRDR